ncbi:MAG: alpha/beta hydrolase [Zoogloeaceae bacterium]|jgi:pimeloyl-ACP methyl ester carboxylesterase|nr:alpha/beta hydrolase [Zoogloeaceae bacterium]
MNARTRPMDELFLRDRIAVQTNDFAPDRETLIFLHGLAGSSSAWEEYIPLFERDFNLVFLDLRGHGKSRRYRDSSEYQISRFAQDLEAIFSDLGITEAILIAHSFGCLVAMDYIARHPEKIRKVVFISARFDTRNRLLFHFTSLVHRLLSPLDSRFPPQCARLDYRNYPRKTNYNPRRIYHDIRNTGLAAFLHCSRQALGVDYSREAAELRCPVLFIHGDRDRVFPVRHARKNQRRLQQSRLEIVPGASHVIVLSHVEVLCEKIRDFVHE